MGGGDFRPKSRLDGTKTRPRRSKAAPRGFKTLSRLSRLAQAVPKPLQDNPKIRPFALPKCARRRPRAPQEGREEVPDAKDGANKKETSKEGHQARQKRPKSHPRALQEASRRQSGGAWCPDVARNLSGGPFWTVLVTCLVGFWWCVDYLLDDFW